LFRVSLSDSLLQTILIPGAIVLFAIGWVFVPSIWAWLLPTIDDCLKAINTFLASNDVQHVGSGVLTTGFLAVAVLLAYLFAVFLGLLLAVAVGFLELYLLDEWCAKRLGVSPTEYQRQWYAYLDSFEKAHNSYVSKQVVAFHFQARTGLALIALFLAFCFHPWAVGSPFVWSLIVLALVIAFLLYSAMYDHRMLAEFRNRRFALASDITKPPEDVLAALVDLWCKRSAVKPLRLVLPVRTEDGNIPDPATTRAALHRLAVR
jgi:hypothetical protein